MKKIETTAEVVARMIAEKGKGCESLLPLLQSIQTHFGALTDEAVQALSEQTQHALVQITATSSFFSTFRRTPVGKHLVRICIGAACHVKGAEQLTESFRRYLKIAEGSDTDPTGEFTVTEVACLGCCTLAPAVEIDHQIFGWVTPEQIPDLLRSVRNNEGNTKDTIVLPNPFEAEARICLCSSCAAAGSEAVYEAVKGAVRRHRFPVKVRSVSCTGMSYCTPLLQITSQGTLFNYGGITPDRVDSILSTHFLPGGTAAGLRFKIQFLTEKFYRGSCSCENLNTETRPYQESQVRIVTEKSGQTTPSDLQEYRRHGGFLALEKAHQLSPEALLNELEQSGLRGRGGGGFPTAQKWRTVFHAQGKEKVIICNADEGDPGAFMDRMLLESFPFRVLEGMLIAAHLLSVQQLWIYIREEYTRAVQMLKDAITELEKSEIISTGRIRLFIGAGAFVCGEEGALLESMEGKRGIPRERPPYPSNCGYFGKPTLINNVETFAALPWILIHGADAFAKIGTESSRGTKTFALAGKIQRGGLIEVPMGTTVRQIVETIGGGALPGKVLKAVQIGGPSGGCLPESEFDLPVDYDALAESGAIMGSGGLVVLDNTDCMVDIARYFLRFTVAESCGKCTFCRVGIQRMLEILDRLCTGEGSTNDLEQLAALGKWIQQGSLCGLGRTAPNPALSTLRHFRIEYEAHLRGICPAGKCKKMLIFIIENRCIGCTRCAQKCPEKAIEFTPFKRHWINQERCTRCGLCKEGCPQKAIIEAASYFASRETALEKAMERS